MNVDKALRELHYVLKKGGVLILTVPLLFGVHAQADFFRWTEAGIRLIIEKAGFHVLVIKKNGGIFSTIGETLRHIPDQIFSMPQKFQVGYIVAFIMYLLLIPFSKLFIILDSWDLKKNFTTGYSILAVK
jgi:SAM-dependent methyltransferase